MNAITIQSFTFNDVQVSFTETAYLNATKIARHFGKLVKDYLKTDRTQDYIQALAEVIADGNNILSVKNQLVIIKKGGNPTKQGTWLHPKLAIDFARWLNPKFAVWCDMQIEKILKNEQRTDSEQREPLIRACEKLAVGNTIRSDVYTMVANRFGYDKPINIPASLLPEAVAFVYEEILARQEAPQNPNYDPEYGEKYRLVGQATNLAVMKITEELVNELGSIKERLLKVRGLAGISHEGFVECKHGVSLTWEQQLEARRQSQDLINDYVERGKVTFHQ